jgi:putative alpha-1,2-mannosidase
VKAKNASDRNIYIQSAARNGKPYDKSYITHEDILSGATFEFEMGEKPNTEWAVQAESLPYSMSRQ